MSNNYSEESFSSVSSGELSKNISTTRVIFCEGCQIINFHYKRKIQLVAYKSLSEEKKKSKKIHMYTIEMPMIETRDI